jgi:choline dehydrogenase-like flavoprotein
MTDRADVLVIGAGASGAAAAWVLARAGRRVTILEQGDWIDPAAYPQHRTDWERFRQTIFNRDPNVRQLPEDYPVDVTETPIDPLMFNAVGGSTIHWTGHFPRFRPSDFRVKSLDGVADDWPVDYAELEPYYDRNDAFIGVTGLAGDPSNPPRSARPYPSPALDATGEAFVRGLETLGWHWWPSDAAYVRAPHHPGRLACNGCGPCDIGCPIGAMSSAHVTYIPEAVKLGAQVVTKARVREILVDSDGKASGAAYYDAHGHLQVIHARTVVVAANGVGTPRLLLNSRSARFPNGLANSSDLVGRNFMFHPVAIVRGVLEERIDSYEGPTGALLNSQEFYETDAAKGAVRGYQLQLVRDPLPVGTALGRGPGKRLPWGRGHHDAHRRQFGHGLTVVIMTEDLPEAHNRVTLSESRTDTHGIPAAKLSYTLSKNSRALLDHGIARATELVRAAGATEVTVDPLARVAGWHLMGTTKMGNDPAHSVVDRWGRTHDVPNLFVVDGSIFVTSAPVNPTSTIQALALRTAEWLDAHFAEVAA